MSKRWAKRCTKRPEPADPPRPKRLSVRLSENEFQKIVESAQTWETDLSGCVRRVLFEGTMLGSPW